jgi:hypothetical protein
LSSLLRSAFESAQPNSCPLPKLTPNLNYQKLNKSTHQTSKSKNKPMVSNQPNNQDEDIQSEITEIELLENHNYELTRLAL